MKRNSKRCFSSCHEREFPWGLQIPRSDALPQSHRDSMVSEIYYEVHMRRVLHSARISNVDSVIFENLTYFQWKALNGLRRNPRKKRYIYSVHVWGLLVHILQACFQSMSKNLGRNALTNGDMVFSSISNVSQNIT